MTRILQNDGPMDGIFTADEVATVKAWIQAGAETPHDLDRLMGRRMEDLPPEESAARTAAQDFVRQRPMIGMGSVH
jgi:hypothetical protein